MNVWVVHAGFNSESRISVDIADKISEHFFDEKEREVFEYSNENVHYLSVTNKNVTTLKYNSEERGSLYGYSGLPVAINKNGTDLRSVDQWTNAFNVLPNVMDIAFGQFTAFKANVNSFECVIDKLGYYNIYYHTLPDKSVLITNHLPYLQELAQLDLNHSFFLEYLFAGGIRGYDTKFKDVHTLPEYGWLQWDKKNGIAIKQYEPTSNLIPDYNSSNIDDFFEKLVEEYENGSDYLVRYHNMVIPLSGGVDSRTVLHMFWNKDKSGIQCYNYPDQPLDSILAKKVAKANNVPLKKFSIDSKLPSVEKLYNFVEQWNYSLLDFSDVFIYLFNEEQERLFSPKYKTVIYGNGGGTNYGLKLLENFKGLSLDQLIPAFVNRNINRTALKEHGYNLINETQVNYYKQKYLPLLTRNTASLDFLTLFFFLERSRSYKAQQVLESNQNRLLFLPYLSEKFIQLVNATPADDRGRDHSGSIHSKISSYFTKGNDKKIRFVQKYHWDANKLQRMYYWLQKRHLDHRISKDKYSAIVRLKFLEQNRDEFQSIITNDQSSFLWDYVEKNELLNILRNQEKFTMNEAKLFLKFIPTLMNTR